MKRIMRGQIKCSLLLMLTAHILLIILLPPQINGEQTRGFFSKNFTTPVTRVPRVEIRLASETGMLNRITTTPTAPTTSNPDPIPTEPSLRFEEFRRISTTSSQPPPPPPSPEIPMKDSQPRFSREEPREPKPSSLPFSNNKQYLNFDFVASHHESLNAKSGRGTFQKSNQIPVNSFNLAEGGDPTWVISSTVLPDDSLLLLNGNHAQFDQGFKFDQNQYHPQNKLVAHQPPTNDNQLRNVRRNSFDEIIPDDEDPEQKEYIFAEYEPLNNLKYAHYTDNEAEDEANFAQLDVDHSKYFIKTKVKDRSINPDSLFAFNFKSNSIRSAPDSPPSPSTPSTSTPFPSSTTSTLQPPLGDKVDPRTSSKIQHSEHSHSYSSYSNTIASPLKYFDFQPQLTTIKPGLNDPLALSSNELPTLSSSTISNSLADPGKYATDSTSIPGIPGIDYPIFNEVPLTSFDCLKQRYKGFFADVETKCQTWHFCGFNNDQSTFICPNGTLFSQVLLTCDWYFNVDCKQAEQLYVLNESLYKYIKPPIRSFPEDFHGELVDFYLLSQLKAGVLPKKRKKSKDKLVINGRRK